MEIGVITLSASLHKQSDALVERKTIMTPFMTEDFLLDTEFARRLYHD
ncbi:glucuronate isomerase, partial [Salmonella enterica subsp. enterica serovar Enteritidis]|nr:glucuronate isomerase [Salmonella enterica subsp. enterica serovar Enteritidis]